MIQIDIIKRLAPAAVTVLTLGCLAPVGERHSYTMHTKQVPFADLIQVIKYNGHHCATYNYSDLGFARPVTVDADRVSLAKLLQLIFKGQDALGYSMTSDSSFIIFLKSASPAMQKSVKAKEASTDCAS